MVVTKSRGKESRGAGGSWTEVCPGAAGRGWTGVVSLTEYIQPVCLPAAGQALVDGKICTVTGWGNTQYYGESCPPGRHQRETLSRAGMGSLAGGMNASWPWGVGTPRSPGWVWEGEAVRAPQLWPALPPHPQANRLGCSRRPECP